MSKQTFKLWAASDAHVGTDLERGNRRSLAEAILQSERGGDEGGPPFDWDIMLNAGDYSGSQMPPDDEEGMEVVRQYGVSTKHGREDFYSLFSPVGSTHLRNHHCVSSFAPLASWFPTKS